MKTLTLILCVLSIISFICPAIAAQDATPGEKEALAIGTEAYIYGYPLVTMEMTRRVMTNVASPAGMRAPMGRFINAREYPTAAFRDVTAPNADTLYSVAWLDLSRQPYVLSLPDEKGRYYLMPMLDAWTNVFAEPGTRTTGTDAHTYAITGPNWTGALPAGIKELKSPTNLVWILGRTYCTGTPKDYMAVHAIQDRYKLVPLSFYGKSYTPPAGRVDPNIDMKTPVRTQVNRMDAVTYFKTLAALLKDNPPAATDGRMIEKLVKIGIVPGREFDLGKLDPTVAKALREVPPAAQQRIAAQFKDAGTMENGWTFSTKTGTYGTDYQQRAFITEIGLGANLPQDAVYPASKVDADGKPYNGANNYTLTFAADQIPPVNGFWSLTMYDADYFFTPNPLNRYTLSPRNNLNFNQDGSLTLYIQNTSPGADKVSNWLPAPKGKFNLMLRLYWPKEPVLEGFWKPPAVKRIEP